MYGFLRQGFILKPRLAWNLWPPYCHSFPSARITGMSHQSQISSNVTLANLPSLLLTEEPSKIHPTRMLWCYTQDKTPNCLSTICLYLAIKASIIQPLSVWLQFQHIHSWLGVPTTLHLHIMLLSASLLLITLVFLPRTLYPFPPSHLPSVI